MDIKLFNKITKAFNGFVVGGSNNETDIKFYPKDAPKPLIPLPYPS